MRWVGGGKGSASAVRAEVRELKQLLVEYVSNGVTTTYFKRMILAHEKAEDWALAEGLYVGSGLEVSFECAYECVDAILKRVDRGVLERVT